MAPAVSNFPICAGIVRFVRNQRKDTLPPPRRSARPLGSIVGQDESSKPLPPACGLMSYDVLNPGMAFGNAGPSTIFASMVFHCARNDAMPSAVIRSTKRAGTRDGAKTGSGGAGAAGAGGACAAAILMEAAPSTEHATSQQKSFVSIVSPLIVNHELSTLRRADCVTTCA